VARSIIQIATARSAHATHAPPQYRELCTGRNHDPVNSRPLLHVLLKLGVESHNQAGRLDQPPTKAPLAARIVAFGESPLSRASRPLSLKKLEELVTKDDLDFFECSWY